MEKTKIITTGVIILWMIGTVALWFSYFGSETESALRSINSEMTMLETQILENKAEWTILDNDKQDIITEMKTYETANNELRTQIKDLNNEKKILGLN